MKRISVPLTALLLVGLAVALEEQSPKCTVSVTTASGTKARAGPYCTGELIFEDNFNTLDFETWEHENTLSGGGVSNHSSYLCVVVQVVSYTSVLFTELGVPVVP